MSSRILRVAAVIGLAVLVIALFLVSRTRGHEMTVKAYFTDGAGLRAGAAVRLAGVDIGNVRSVRARPEMKETPVEVVMLIRTAEEMRIPNDSTASLSTAGVLGETYVNIDARSASGPPIQSGGTLKTAPAERVTMDEILKKLDSTIKKNCDCDSKKDDSKETRKETLTQPKRAN